MLFYNLSYFVKIILSQILQGVPNLSYATVCVYTHIYIYSLVTLHLASTGSDPLLPSELP